MTAYDTIQLIKTLYTQMEQVIGLSNAAYTPFTPSQIFAMAYIIALLTGEWSTGLWST